MKATELVHACGAVYYAVQVGPNFRLCGQILKEQPFKWKLLSSTFPNAPRF